MEKKKSVKRMTVAVPKSTKEVAKFIGKIGGHQRELDEIQTNLNNQVEKIKAQAVTNSLSHQTAIDQLFEGIFIFAQSRRDELTEGGKKKTVSLPTGEILWRLTPPAVLLKNVKKVIELCKSLGLKRFIRVKEEIDKKAMLKEPEEAAKIKGVKIEQKEDFVVKPSEVKIEFIKTDKGKLQKVLPKK